jgi:hypothetical protein
MADRYAGIDWASDKHDVLVADETGTEVLAATYAHDENGLSALCRVLLRLEVVLVAVERPDGLLVERLLDAGLQVLPLHPNKVAAARDRFRVSGGKSDRFDAFVLCELARTDHHRFRVLERRLAPAVGLYESVGFRHVPRERVGPLPYTRANVFMELPL